MKVKDIDDLDENRQVNILLMCIGVRNLVLLGPAVCARDIFIHFVVNAHTDF